MNKSIILQVGVKIFLRNNFGEYLFLKRSSLVYPRLKKCLWDIPGGRIVPGTSLFDNLRREVSEETGLDIKRTAVKFIYAQDILHSNIKHIVRLTFLGDVSSETSGQIVLNYEHVDYLWETPDKILLNTELDEFTREVIEKGLLM